jgi:hypothetical protein
VYSGLNERIAMARGNREPALGIERKVRDTPKHGARAIFLRRDSRSLRHLVAPPDRT